MNKPKSATAHPPKNGNHRTDNEQEAHTPKNSPAYYEAAKKARESKGDELDNRTQARNKRDTLFLLTQRVRPLVEAGKFETVNQAIIKVFYSRHGHVVFKSFNGWKAEGKKVIAGMKGFAVWSRPKTVTRKQAGRADEKKDVYNTAYLFSNLQVEKDPLNKLD